MQQQYVPNYNERQRQDWYGTPSIYGGGGQPQDVDGVERQKFVDGHIQFQQPPQQLNDDEKRYMEGIEMLRVFMNQRRVEPTPKVKRKEGDDASATQPGCIIPIATWLASIHPALCVYAKTMGEFGYGDTFFLKGAPDEELEKAFDKCSMAIAHRRLIRDAAKLLRDDVAPPAWAVSVQLVKDYFSPLALAYCNEARILRDDVTQQVQLLGDYFSPPARAVYNRIAIVANHNAFQVVASGILTSIFFVYCVPAMTLMFLRILPDSYIAVFPVLG